MTTPDTKDLTERLRDLSRRGYWPLIGYEAATLIEQQADELERLRAQVAGNVATTEQAPAGWAFELGDGCITVSTPSGGIAVLWEWGHGGVEHLAYKMAAMLAAPAQQADRFQAGYEAAINDAKTAQRAEFPVVSRWTVAADQAGPKARVWVQFVEDGAEVEFAPAVPSLTVGEPVELAPVLARLLEREPSDPKRKSGGSGWRTLTVRADVVQAAREALARHRTLPAAQAEPVATLWREQRQDLYPGPSIKLTPAGEALPLGVLHKLYAAPQSNPPAQGIESALRLMLATFPVPIRTCAEDQLHQQRAIDAARDALAQAQKEQP